jgi:hypothetical protein
MIEARLSSKAIRLLYDIDWYTEDSGTPSACEDTIRSRDSEHQRKKGRTLDMIMYSPPSRLYGLDS